MNNHVTVPLGAGVGEVICVLFSAAAPAEPGDTPAEQQRPAHARRVAVPAAGALPAGRQEQHHRLAALALSPELALQPPAESTTHRRSVSAFSDRVNTLISPVRVPDSRPC